MEARRIQHTLDGPRADWFGGLLHVALPVGAVALRAACLYRRGVGNALAVQRSTLTVADANLPPAFDRYRILQLSDLQFDALPGLADRVIALLEGTVCDLCVLTGDFQARRRPRLDPVVLVRPLSELVTRVRARDGFLAVLGNHDSCRMVDDLEPLGIRVLANEHVRLEHDDAAITVVGVDDVGWFFTEGARQALDALPHPRPFTIGLVHSPEFAAEAAEAGCRLYLCGHTHGGQICLPGGRPLLRRIRRHRSFARGRWTIGTMTGYTSRGVGVSEILPARFNCAPEIAEIELRRA